MLNITFWGKTISSVASLDILNLLYLEAKIDVAGLVTSPLTEILCSCRLICPFRRPQKLVRMESREMAT
jgi:hypothetical protein